MPNYRRAWSPGGTCFFTVNLLERRQTLLTDHIERLRGTIRDVRRRFLFTIFGWVVLSEHLHCIIEPQAEDLAGGVPRIPTDAEPAQASFRCLTEMRLAGRLASAVTGQA